MQAWKRLRDALTRTPLLLRVLIANGAVVVVGAIAGTLLTKTLAQRSAFELAAVFAAGGVALSLAINYVVLRVALRPLSSLTSTVDRVQDGFTAVRADAPRNQDPDISRLTNALNTMLDRLAAHTATIEANREQLRRLSSQVITAQEEERRRIARELHDETSQSLATLMISLERVDAAIPDDLSELKTRLASARELTGQTLEGLRALVADLRPLLLDDLGLVPAIRWYAGDRLEPEGIDVSVEAPTDLPRLPQRVESALFRISQEAVSNVLKHADASQVRVLLACDGALTLTVEDDGAGFDPNEVPEGEGSRHMGLFSIRERAAALGGDVTIDSAPGEGTRVRVRIPLDTE